MQNSLFSDFPEVPEKQWKQKIQVELDGADYNETLLTRTAEDINIKPFYCATNGKEPQISVNPKWNICEKIYVTQEAGANAKALRNIQKGTESLHFILPDNTTDFSALFKDFPFKSVKVHLEPQFLSASYVKDIIAFFSDKEAKLHLHIDIIGHLAQTGNWYNSLKDDMKAFEEIHTLASSCPQIITNVAINTSLYQNAGANMVQELAYAMAHANEYLNILDGKAFKPCFLTSVGSNYFFEIAKLKALRLLWGTVAEAYNNHHEAHVYCIPTKRNKTLYDYNVNMLRTTTEYMSAIIGGSNTICTLLYDAIYHKNNEFAGRIARNQLLILKHESYFDKVRNPSDGSYYMESITDEMAEKALTLFKQIESGGGFLQQLKDHVIQKKIKENALKEQQAFDAGQKILVGTNKYQNKGDQMQDQLELYPFVKTEVRKTLIAPIIEQRIAETSEQQRLKTESK
ncbi:methylmalonyl-CoA mutase subunit beta [Galbibacter sp. PAP.153]|uniref:methylmalonyl-CoA mutase subunit beta n=1 Tax=Galbibacter sp. PAP.153 TaxID=3104623 RepID=UPI00300A8276